MPGCTPKRDTRNGLTLIELLAVLLIAGLLAAASVPAFNAILKGTALRTAAKGLTDTLALARQLAITNRYMYHVELDDRVTVSEKSDEIKDNSLQKDRYRIYFIDRKAKDRHNPKDSDKITVGKWRLLPEFVEYELKGKTDPDKVAEIIFKPTGGAQACDEGGRGLWYTDQGGWRFKVVRRASGAFGEEKAAIIRVKQVTGASTWESAEAH